MESLLYPLATEKAIRMIESDNVITFVVGDKATRGKIKTEFQKRFKTKINSIRIIRDTKGNKKAYITLSKKTPAMDIATQLGLM